MWRTHYVLHCHISWWAKGKWYCTILLATLERDSKLCSVSLQSSLILNGTGSPSQYWPILRTHLHPYLKKHMFRFNHRKGFVLHKMFLVNLCQAFQHGQGSRTGLSRKPWYFILHSIIETKELKTRLGNMYAIYICLWIYNVEKMHFNRKKSLDLLEGPVGCMYSFTCSNRNDWPTLKKWREWAKLAENFNLLTQ